MNSKKHIAIIPAILKQKGVEHIVISPGSRNAPLIQVFYALFKEKCISIVDERSAAFFALGIALKTAKPVVILTTSGTAVLNLAPAMAEAFHQGVPLLAITADRPPEWIDQQDNQTIRQKDALLKNSKAAFELPLSSHASEDLWLANRIVNQAYNIASSGKLGPVHINVPLREPLYLTLPAATDFSITEFKEPICVGVDSELLNSWKKAKRIMLVCGQHIPDKALQLAVNQLSKDTKIVVVSEAIANCKGEQVISNIDLILHAFQEKAEKLSPDLVLYFGGQIVSKRLKEYLRKQSGIPFWFISPEGHHVDTFQNLSLIIHTNETPFLESLVEKSNLINQSDYSNKWRDLSIKMTEKIALETEAFTFSDILVCKELSDKLTNKDILFAGNSSIIRYLQMFKNNADSVFANRGTSGIDGCISTASGIATVANKNVVAIVGDLSFVYDSNGLWNRNLPQNLKIVVVNNRGGGIFSLIDGPPQQEAFTPFFEAHHPVAINKISEAFGIAYFLCKNKETLAATYHAFYATKGSAILEVETTSELNNKVFRNFIKKLKSNEQ
jgi:2-succinyl-5-enolpyruvyl-6-hydroxy-3-cyclohexene-1-carboxylate synthase